MVAIALGGLGAATSIVSGSMAAGAHKDAAKSNNALQEDIYNQNKETLSPYVSRGNSAGNALNSLLGVPASGGGSANSGSSGNVDWGAYVRGNPDALADYVKYHSGMDIADYGQYHYAADGSRRDLTPYESQSSASPGNGGSATDQQNAAFQNYLNSTGYQFQLNQGLKSVQAALGAKGLTDSGAEDKAINNYAQNAALTGFGQYANLLAGQQGTGLSAAGAQAGVGTKYANAVSQNNNDAADASASSWLNIGHAVNAALGNAAFGSGYNAALNSSYKPSAPSAYGIPGSDGIY